MTASEEAKVSRERAEEQAEIAHKYAQWTTPQLISERDSLAEEVGGPGPVIWPKGALGVIGLVKHRQAENNFTRFKELNQEIERRKSAAPASTR